MKITPVVHAHSPEQAVEQAKIAFDAGVDGVFLIAHEGDELDLLDDYRAVRAEFRDRYIGLNYLIDPLQGYRVTKHALDTGYIDQAPDALWFDDITGSITDQAKATSYMEEVEKFRHADPQLAKIQLLGGVAFKYTPTHTSEPLLAARRAHDLSRYVDVVTTSGPGTNMAPPPQKIASMKRASGDKPLAVASGISAENISDYGSTIDQILVSSSLETKPYSGVFIADRIKKLVRLVRESK